MESSKKKRNSVLPIIVSVGIATSMGVVANSTPEVAYAISNAAASASTTTYADRSSSENDKNQVITFKDSVLKSKLLAVMKEQNIIANDAKDITIADAEKLTRANLRNWSVDSLDDSNTIHNLTGLEHFNNLVYLNFSNNKVSNLTPLENLTSLEELYFSNNKVSNLTPLENLFLKSLDFSGNQVSDLTPLGVLDSLEDLFFTDNKVSKLDTLQYLHSLKTLDFSKNKVSDLTPLGGLDSLTKLVFDGNKVSDLTPLENLKSLENLLFSDNKVSDLTPLENLKSLKELIFIGNQVSDLTPLENLKKLDTLKMGNQTIAIDSNDKETTLPVSDVTFTIQGEEGNSIGSITNGVFTLSKNLPYSGTISIDFKRDNIKIGSVTASYTGTITLNLNVPKIDGGVTTWAIKAKMKYEADSSLNYQEKKVEKAAIDGTRTTYADGRNTVEVPAQDGLTKVGNVEITHEGDKTITTTYTVDPDTGKLSNPQKHTSMPIGNLTGSTKTEILHGVMKYEADSSLDYNTQKKISDPVDGKKVTTSVINGDSKVEITPAKNGLTKVGNKQVTHDGNKTITTTYDVDPNTGKLTNPKKHTSMPAGNLTPAKNLPKTVTFKDGDEQVASVKVEKGQAIATDNLTDQSMPKDPIKSGYTFKGWNTKADGQGTAFTGTTTVDNDLTVYAMYTQNPVTPPAPTPSPLPTPTPAPKHMRADVLPKTGETSLLGTLLAALGLSITGLGVIYKKKTLRKGKHLPQ
ncbi:leucine-rich repeat protein [Fannyhessea vaginae]|uniref:leucine-rich repeat protein n=1 Tax=Fannyhessea vaginae TaxID=82135 RepID=UPI00336A98B0